jgi:hypothetical protein
MGKGTNRILRPGTPAPVSGQYVQTGPRGGNPSETETTVVQDRRLPPTTDPGNRWRLVDPTKHKN